MRQFSEQETCTNLAVAEQIDAFYCGDPYGRLSERDIDSGAVVRSLDAQNGNTGSLWIAADETELVSFGTFVPVVARWRLDGSGPVTRTLAHGAKPIAFNHTSDLLLYEPRSCPRRQLLGPHHGRRGRPMSHALTSSCRPGLTQTRCSVPHSPTTARSRTRDRRHR